MTPTTTWERRPAPGDLPLCVGAQFPWKVSNYGVGAGWAYTLSYSAMNLLVSVRCGCAHLIDEADTAWYASWSEGGASMGLATAVPLSVAIRTAERHYRKRIGALRDKAQESFQALQVEALKLRGAL